MILIKAIISEKSMKQAQGGLYTFVVDKKMRKPVIARAVEERFGVDVIAIKTLTYKKEKKIQRGRKGYYIQSAFKKAAVKLKDGQKIALFETEIAQDESEAKTEVKETKSLLKGTKVKVERTGKKDKVEKE